MTVKERIHQLVEELPEHERVAAERYLELLRDREADLPRSLREAPIDDEPDTEEERAGVAEARAELDAGQGIPHGEALRVLLAD